MSESLVGFSVAAIRQKVERLLKASTGPSGGTNAPGATVCALVIVVSVRESEARLSQVAAAEVSEVSIVTNIGAKITPTSFMSRLLRPFGGATPRGGKITTNEVRRETAGTFGWGLPPAKRKNVPSARIHS
jgi:hypothetical protein